MGGFATSIHVRPADVDPQDVVQTVTSALVKVMAAEGLRPAGSGETPDRAVVVVRTSRSPHWVAVFDEHAETQDDTNEQIARALSSKLDAPAVTMLVHDGDIGQVHLIAGGDVRDKYSSAPDYFGPVSAAEKRAWKGAPSEWARAFGNPSLESKLKKAFKSDGADETLGAVAEALGIDEELAHSGYNSSDEIGHVPMDPAEMVRAYGEDVPPYLQEVMEDAKRRRQEVATVTYDRERLAFRYVDDRATKFLHSGLADLWWNFEGGIPEDDAEGASLEFAAQGGQAAILFKAMAELASSRSSSDIGAWRSKKLSVGGELPVFEPAHNRGGLSEGVILEVGGSALESGLVELKKVVARNDSTWTEQPLTHCATWPQLVRFEKFLVGPGFQNEDDKWALKGQRAKEIQSARQVFFDLALVGSKKGSGEMTLWLRSPTTKGRGRLRRVPIVVE